MKIQDKDLSKRFPARDGWFVFMKGKSMKEFLDYAVKERDLYLPSRERAMLKAVQSGEGGGILSHEAIKDTKYRLVNEESGSMRLTRAQAEYYLKEKAKQPDRG